MRDGRREQVNTNSTLHLCWTNLTRWCDCGAARSGTDGVLDLDSYVACVGGAHRGTATEIPVKFGHLLAACASLPLKPARSPNLNGFIRTFGARVWLRPLGYPTWRGLSGPRRMAVHKRPTSSSSHHQSVTHRRGLPQGLHLRNVACPSWVVTCRSFSFSRSR